MLSICIPTYEQKGMGQVMLKALLTSIAKQKTNIPFEVVISDNATDGSIKAVCAAFPELPIKYYFNPVRGASENINNAISLCNYNKIKPMMQDDLFYTSDALDRFSQALDSHGWVLSNSHHINEKGLITGKRLVNYQHGNFDKNTVGMPSVIAFRACDLRFDARLKTICDMYFYHQLFEKYGHPAVIKELTIAQRFHNASLSRNQPSAHDKEKEFLFNSGMVKKGKPKIVVAVVVYDRHQNIDLWLNCWQQSQTYGAQLVIIHNNDEKTTGYYTKDGVHYLSRPNIGYDIGAFQDVCRSRLAGFPDYDYLLWCTDDTIPMTKDFIKPFIDNYGPGVGITCMQMSDEIVRHVRTTGFCIKKDIARKLVFATDPVKTIRHCKHFEHLGGRLTLLKQIVRMGLRVIQLSELADAPLYDMGFWQRNEEARKVAHLYDRMNEHEKTFKCIKPITAAEYAEVKN